uniref:Monocarboxylate transporter 12-like n=1 Tax=Diabrotica virgifera virgifera TaxID=50390 RepID=A0A6P7G3T6_DIAVI
MNKLDVISYSETTKCEPQQEESEHEDSLPAPPDGGYGWVIVFASFICNMMVDGVTYCFGIFLPDLVTHYGSTEAKVAWVGSILAGTTMCTGPIVSAVTNKYGCRVSCMAGAVIAAASFALSVFSPSVEVLMLIYGAGGGIGFGLMYVPAVVCVGYYFESKRSLATGMAVCGSGFGTIVFAPFGRFLLVNYGWKGANIVLAVLCLTCTFFGFLMKPLEYKKPERTVTMVYQNGTANITDDMKKSYTSLVSRYFLK